jgi:hypothetical protein
LEEHSADYRTVAVFGSSSDAENARGLLESDGIVAAVREVGGAREVGPAQARLLVPSRDLDRARQVLGPGPEAVQPEADLEAPLPEKDHAWTVGWLALIVAAAVALLALFAL